MKEVSDKSIADTGERMVPAHHKGHLVYGEHIVRYQAATELVKGKVVLDIASGSGYGTRLLAETAKKVYGVDLDDDALAYAKKNYAASNVVFKKGDGVKIPLQDNAVDVVVTFETIEHIEDYTTFMKEVKRVLKDDGLLVLSTPNDVEFPETNHFHVHEFEQKELERLVKKFFANTSSYYQGTWLYNGMFPEDQLTGEWRGPVDTMQTAPITKKQCIYFYMLCANRPVTESLQPLAAISQHYSERTVQEYEQSVRTHIEAQGEIMRDQKDKLKQRDAEIQGLRTELKHATQQLERFHKSLPGRLYHKAASVRRHIR
jgi:ubiquinone/menaquinone biosynthesis C-methylase UbiE